MAIPLSATEAARRFSDLLNRVQYRGETFIIVRNGQEIARITAAPRLASRSLKELAERLETMRTGDPDFARDLEQVQDEQPPVGEGPWAS